MTESKILDMLERAYKASCFLEVLKMIRAKTSEVVIEKVIQKTHQKQIARDIDWSDLFGAD